MSNRKCVPNLFLPDFTASQILSACSLKPGRKMAVGRLVSEFPGTDLDRELAIICFNQINQLPAGFPRNVSVADFPKAEPRPDVADGSVTVPVPSLVPNQTSRAFRGQQSPYPSAC